MALPVARERRDSAILLSEVVSPITSPGLRLAVPGVGRARREAVMFLCVGFTEVEPWSE